MKRFLIPFLALALSAPAQAAPVHLTCTETKSSDNDPWTQQLLIDADRGFAKADTTEMNLILKPAEFVLQESETSPDFRMHQIWVNRQTLTFKRKWLFWPSGDPDFGVSREASGQCRITPAPAGNQI